MSIRMLSIDREQIFSPIVCILQYGSDVHKGDLLRRPRCPKMEVAPAFNQITFLGLSPISYLFLHT